MGSVTQAWKYTWNKKSFRFNFLFSLFILIIFLFAIPFFFQYIEQRKGIVINDFVLEKLPVYNVSIIIFGILWAAVAWGFYRVIQSPSTCVLVLWTYMIVNSLRLVTMAAFALNPPEDIIPLADPLSLYFYGGTAITKDLFFSGHTATMFMLYLCLKNPSDKRWMLAGTIVLGILLMIQRVHYSFDVLAAPFFTWISYLSAKWFIEQSRR